MNDRDALIAAVRTSRNLGVAARRLDVSRRTLQNRMREYGLPRGRGGRPKRDLALDGSGGAFGVLAVGALLLGGGLLIKRWLTSSSST